MTYLRTGSYVVISISHGVYLLILPCLPFIYLCPMMEYQTRLCSIQHHKDRSFLIQDYE
ncbi:hypothetical protein BDV11DRAFT_189782 [Aspergillus similis]